MGLITYLRTDSTRISEEADAGGKSLCSFQLRRKLCRGGNHRGEKNECQKDPGCPRGHPSFRYHPVADSGERDPLSRDQFRLYQLIWKRFTASRMANAVYETTQVKIQAGDYNFHVSASTSLLRRLHVRLCGVSSAEKEENNVLLKGIGTDTKAEPERVSSGTALYPAAGSLHRGRPGKNAGGAGYRTPQYLRADDHDDHRPPLCGQGERRIST